MANNGTSMKMNKIKDTIYGNDWNKDILEISALYHNVSNEEK